MRAYDDDLIPASALETVDPHALAVFRELVEVEVARSCGFHGRIRLRDRSLSRLLDRIVAVEDSLEVAA